MASANELIIKINGDAKNFLSEIDKIKKNTKDLNQILGTVAKASAAAFVGLTATIAAVTKVYADYETALVGVGKTTNITGKELDRLGKRIGNLSSTIPLATNELLGIAQAAGQLGVTGEENLVKFTDTVARLGVATDLTGEQAATSLTRILTVTGEGVENIDRFGSVIVQLGNNFAATESEIVHMTTEVSRSIGIFGVSATEAAGLSTALKAMGVRAELGGSAVARAFRAISASVTDGGQKLKDLKTLTGRTGDELKRVFEKDSVGAFEIFIQSLGSIPAAEVAGELAKFGLKGEEILKVLPALAKNSGLLSRALNTAKKEFKDNTALMTESQAAFDTLNSETKLLRNEITEFAKDIGAQLAPEIRNLVGNIRDVVKWFKNLSDETKSNIASFLKWGAIISGAIAAVATFLAGLVAAVAAFTAVQGALAAVGIVVTGLLGPIGAVVVAVGVLSLALNEVFDRESENKVVKDLEQISKELAVAKKRQEELRQELETPLKLSASGLIQRKKETRAIEEEIEALEKLRLQAIKTDAEFGTGSLLFRPENDDFDFSLKDLPEQNVNAPLALDPKVREEEVQADETAKELEAAQAASIAKRKAAEEQAIADRLSLLKDEQSKVQIQKDLFNAQESDRFNKKENELLAKEAEFATKKIELAAERRAAEAITDEASREQALATNALKNTALAEQEAAFSQRADEVRAEERERKAALDEELRAIDKETRDSLNAEDLETLRNKIQTEDEIERKIARDKALRNIATRNKEIEDTKKHGVVVATLNKFFASEEVQGLKRTTSDLQELRNSSNKTQRRIGKAAARANAAIKTAEGAISAYTSLSAIPIVGPALGFSAALALTAYGIEQQRKIDAVSAQRGGVVPDASGLGGARDRIPALLEPGELVVPRALAPDFIQSQGRPEVSAEGGGGNNFSVQIGLADDLLDFVEDGLNERRALNITNEGIQ